MNLTKLASGSYDLKVTIDGKETAFTSNEFANANQLHKVLVDKLEGISSLKKSTFYGVKFEEVLPGVFVGERRIPGFGLYHFQFTGAPVALDVPFDPAAPSSLSETCSGGCSGNVGCENLCCHVDPTKIPVLGQAAANEDELKIEGGFFIGELGGGELDVFSPRYHLLRRHKFNGSGSPVTLLQAILVSLAPWENTPDANKLAFLYSERYDSFTAKHENITLVFRKAKPTLKETFLGWLKNILG